MRQSFRIKPSAGAFFAAGEGFEQALAVLSDPAFKLFAHVCLRARRPAGTLEFERAELARQLGKSRSTLGRCLQELVRQGVCRIEPAANQHRRSRLTVCARFWPYAAVDSGQAQPGDPAADYVASVRQAFWQPSCVQGRCNADEECLARHWQSSGVPLESACNAILLGCALKSIALLEQPAGLPIRSLHYFQPLLEEVLAAAPQTYPPQYWQHLRQHLLRCEQHWARHGGWPVGRPARPNLTQAEPQLRPLGAAATDTGGTE
jgi:hypothetical protein